MENLFFIKWKELSIYYNLSNGLSSNLYSIILNYYNEKSRHYHTINHINELLSLSNQFNDLLKNNHIIDLAIIFHDIIYDPTKSDNEDESAKIFKTLLTDYIPIDDLNLICKYIIETKYHNAHDSSDSDLRYFIDFDLAILSKPRDIYLKYASNIRKEYQHIDSYEYCRKRAMLLRSLINHNKYIYATDLFRNDYENVARDNLIYECELLDSGIIP